MQFKLSTFLSVFFISWEIWFLYLFSIFHHLLIVQKCRKGLLIIKKIVKPCTFHSFAEGLINILSGLKICHRKCGNCIGEPTFIQIWNMLLYLKLNVVSFSHLLLLNVAGFIVWLKFSLEMWFHICMGDRNLFCWGFISTCFGSKWLVIICMCVTLMPIFLG